MSFSHLTDAEVVLELANAFKRWRVSPRGAGLTQEAISERSGTALTSVKRFEKTGNITLRNFIALLRAADLLDRLEELVPDPGEPSPLDLLQAQSRPARRRAYSPRKKKDSS